MATKIIRFYTLYYGNVFLGSDEIEILDQVAAFDSHRIAEPTMCLVQKLKATWRIPNEAIPNRPVIVIDHHTGV